MPQVLNPHVVTTEAHAQEPVIHEKPLQCEEQAPHCNEKSSPTPCNERKLVHSNEDPA